MIPFDAPHVRVWYTKDGRHAVRAASSRLDGVPDDVARVAEVTEDALARYAQMGYRERLFLFATVLALKPQRCLEIGVSEGGSISTGDTIAAIK